MRKRFLTFPLFLLAALIVTVSASAAVESGRVEIANRSDANGAFSCDVKLSGQQAQGKVFAVLFTESGQMKRVSEYPAAESVQVVLQDVAETDFVKILWTDANQMPLASPAVLRMSGNNAAAYAQFAQDLTGLKVLEPSGVSESSEPYALARLIVSADALPDLSGYDVQTVSGPDHLHILQFKTSGEAERCEKYLKSSRAVRYAEPDLIITANGDSAGTGTPRSWGVKETGIGAYAESLRERGINNSVTVAVVDSGVDAAHPFLKGRLVSGYDFVDRDDAPQDGHGHGTHVAGTVVDCTPGMKVSVMPVRVLDDNAGGTLLDIFLGIRYAADNGANVINLSLSLRSHSDMIEVAIRDAISKNVTVVVAAGNYNGNAAFYCPAHTRDCITVAAVDSTLKRYERSNYGGAVDVAAPGVNVESSHPGGGFREMSGTSMATPHVSAAAALLISELGASQTPSQISAAIRGAARAIPKDAGDFEWQRYDGNDFLGVGFLDMRAFIQEPERQFYAHLYADGEMAFQTSRTPDPNKTLVQTYPVSASAGAGEYAAWHSRRAEIRTVTFVDSIHPNSTALWFYGCENLTEIRELENLDVSAVTNMSQMFSCCGSLTKLDLSALHTENVRNMRFIFFSCGKLTELDLTGWNTANVTDMSDMFNGCAALKTVYASDSFKTDGVSNDVGMFTGCTSLIGGSGTKFDSGHTDKEYARIDTTSAPGYFTDKNAPTNDIYAVLYADGELVFQNNNRMDSGRTVTDVYKVEGSYSWESKAPWFGQWENIMTVTFADKIRPDSTAYWFYGCGKLVVIQNIKNLDTANVTDMSFMFSDCSGLTALDVSRFNTANVTDMQSMFSACNGLTELDLSRFDTANVTDMRAMFYACSGMTALDVSRFDTAKVTDMRSMFYSCGWLTALDVSRFDTANVTNMQSMFAGCSRLTALDVSHFDTANVTSMRAMFSDCSGLTALDVSRFDTAKVTDMRAMFYGCSALTALNLSAFNTSNVTSMDGMFYACSKLKTIYISNKFTTASVTSGSSLFYGCSSLVGGAGTAFSDDHTNKDYARIDGGASAPGYFTAPSLYILNSSNEDITDTTSAFLEGQDSAWFRAEMRPARPDELYVWTSSNAQVCKPSQTYGDTVTILAFQPGSAVLTAALEDGSYSASVNIQVAPFQAEFDHTKLNVISGQKAEFNVQSNTWVSCTTDDSSIATVTSDYITLDGKLHCTLTAHAPGTTILTAFCQYSWADKTTNGGKASIPIRVLPSSSEPLVTAYTIDTKEITLNAGEDVKLKVTEWLTDGTSKDVTDAIGLYSSNPKVASVNSDGTVKGVRGGAAHIMIPKQGDDIVTPSPIPVIVTDEEPLWIAFDMEEYTCFLDDIDCDFTLPYSTNATTGGCAWSLGDLSLLYMAWSNEYTETDSPRISVRYTKTGDTRLYVTVKQGEETANASCLIHVRERYDRQNVITPKITYWTDYQGSYPHLDVTFLYHPMSYSIDIVDVSSGTSVWNLEKTSAWLGSSLRTNFGHDWDISSLPKGDYRAEIIAENSFGTVTTSQFDFTL